MGSTFNLTLACGLLIEESQTALPPGKGAGLSEPKFGFSPDSIKKQGFPRGGRCVLVDETGVHSPRAQMMAVRSILICSLSRAGEGKAPTFHEMIQEFQVYDSFPRNRGDLWRRS